MEKKCVLIVKEQAREVNAFPVEGVGRLNAFHAEDRAKSMVIPVILVMDRDIRNAIAVMEMVFNPATPVKEGDI